jgi:putative peptidoglycan lipid II flippase
VKSDEAEALLTPKPKPSSILKAAGLIAVISLISKVIGLFREATIGYYFGTGIVRDAYGIASLWPSQFALIMLAGLNGPFHSSIVSVIAKYKAQSETKNTKTVLFTIIVLSCLFMGAITLLCFHYAPQLIDFIASKDIPEQTKHLAVLQFKIMCPMFFLSGLIGISYGILNVEKIYLTPSLSPVMASLAIIIALVIAPPHSKIYALAWGTMLGAVFQLLLQLIPLFKKLKDYIGFSFEPKHPGVWLVISILLPASLSSTIGQVNILITTYFASGLPVGSISALNYANLIFQLPLGIMLTALLVPMLPILNESITLADNNVTFKKNINKSLRSIIFISVPATFILFCSGEQFTQVLLERGAFNKESTLLTYQVLAASCISLIFYAIRDLLVRVFYALNNAKTPFYSSLGSIVLITFFCWFFIKYLNFAAPGITLAVSFVTISNMIILWVLLDLKIGGWVEPDTIKHLRRVLIATIPVALFCTVFNYFVHYYFTYLTFIIYSVLLGIIGIFCIYILRLLKDEETIEITDKIIVRLKRVKRF